MRPISLLAAPLIGLAILITTGFQSGAGAGPALPPADFVIAPPGTIIEEKRHNDTETVLRIDEIGEFSVTYTRPDRNNRQDTMRPFCWAGCNPKRRPVELERYREIWPLEVGKKATFQRKRDDGSAVWVHKLKVLDTETVETALGPVDTFVVEEKARGTATSNWRGTEKFWFAPTIGWYVKVEWSDNQGKKGRWDVVSVTSPG